MNEEEIYERLTRVVRETLKNPQIQLKSETKPADIAGWDSLNHVNLIVAIEREYETEFSLDELERFSTVADLVALLVAKVS
jgi:acyl carrier protein